MKHCPSCNFSFPDFHQVCDFDGTELIADPNRQQVVTIPPRSNFLRTMKSPVLWAALLLILVLSTAFLTAYLDVTRQSVSAVKAQPSPGSLSQVAVASDQTPAEAKPPESAGAPIASNSPERSGFVHQSRRTTPHRTPTRLSQRTISRERVAPPSIARSQASQVGRREDAKQDFQEKGPKLTAMLKTTWRVLKWPFRF